MTTMTIVDACVEVLRTSREPLSADEIYLSICDRKMIEFKAKDPRGVVRSTIRKHLRQAGPHRLKEVAEAKFTVA